MLNVVRLGYELPQSTLLRVVAELIDHLPLIVLVRDEAQRGEIVTQLSDWGLPAHLLYFLRCNAHSVWVRDFAPLCRRRPGGGLVLLDADYHFGEQLPLEVQFPVEIAPLLRIPRVEVPLAIEGGNVLSNGQGLCLTTRTFIQRNALRCLTVDQLARTFNDLYGFEQLAILKPLISEHTGHVDMFCSFTSPDTVVVGQYESRMDPVNCDVLDENAAVLAGLQTSVGRLNVVRIPMPPNRSGLWRSYTNVVYANGILLVPDYGLIDPRGHQRAKEIYSDLLPGWDIRSVDARRLAFHEGALRCLTSNIPWDEAFNRRLTDTADEPSEAAPTPALQLAVA